MIFNTIIGKEEENVLVDLIQRTISGSYENSELSAVLSYAFANCSQLENVSLENATIISNFAFTECSRLKSVSFANATTISNYAFSNCFMLSNIYLPKVSIIGAGAFINCSSLLEANFSLVDVTDLGAKAFENCINLQKASFPLVWRIYQSTFKNCSELSNIYFPHVGHIYSSAFENDIKLTSVSFPDIASIYTMAFYNCNQLNTVKLGPSMGHDTIGTYAFAGCTRLISLYIYHSLFFALANSNAFDSTPIGGYSDIAGRYGSIFVPSSLVASYQAATNWSYFSSRFVGI